MDESVNALEKKLNKSVKAESRKHQLPPLKYDYAALEPYIDSRTMILHHDNHHASYVKKLNEALTDYPDLQVYSALWLLCNLGQLPAAIKTAVHHNAGGHVNHSLFWRAIKPFNVSEPKGLLSFEHVLDLVEDACDGLLPRLQAELLVRASSQGCGGQTGHQAGTYRAKSD